MAGDALITNALMSGSYKLPRLISDVVLIIIVMTGASHVI